MTEVEGLGRRDRSMRDKRERIFRAASELFAERGFEAVTTQEISDRADVASGTLFRYAASKSELLLMVYNEEFRVALDEGERSARLVHDIVDMLVALLRPSIVSAQERPAESAAYQRELLFGAAGERYRSEGLDLVARLESAIGRALETTADERGIAMDAASLRAASTSVFAAMHLAIARLWTGAHEGADVFDDLRLQVVQIVTGALAASAAEQGAAASAPPRPGEKES